jgi:hypothetical protein
MCAPVSEAGALAGAWRRGGGPGDEECCLSGKAFGPSVHARQNMASQVPCTQLGYSNPLRVQEMYSKDYNLDYN